MRTSEIPELEAAELDGFVIATVEITPGVFRLRRVPKEKVGGTGVVGPAGAEGPAGAGGAVGAAGPQGPQGDPGLAGADGNDGTNGTNGTNGAAGADGADGGFAFQFNTATAGDPGAGKFLFNNGTFGSATQLLISETDGGANDVASFLATLDDSTSTNKCLVTAMKVGGTAYFTFYLTGAITDNGAYDTFSITPIQTAGAIANDDLFRLFFVRVGDKGATGAAGGWDVEITKSADQVVTNDAAPQSDSELSTAVLANSFYFVELILLYSGSDTTGDYRCRFTYPALTNNTQMGDSNTFNAANSPSTVAAAGSATQWPSTDLLLGVVIGDVMRTSYMKFYLRTEAAAGTLQFQFANSAAGVGRTSTTRAGTTLRVKLLL